MKACYGKCDAFAYELLGIFSAITDYPEARMVRSIGSPAAVGASLEDNEMVAHSRNIMQLTQFEFAFLALEN